MAQSLLRLEGLRKSFADVVAVDDVTLEVNAGEFFALLGPSGCGKSTLMRLVAGFETPDAGRILIDGRDVAGDPPNRRPVNMMFQSYALFPHMSVAGNIAFPLRRQGWSSADAQARVTEMLRLVQLDGFGARRPDRLSGGQKARVALARALAARPRLLLLDEPLSALDRKLRDETQIELMALQRETGTAFLVVTHDQDEALAMAQRVALMREGRIEQTGTPAEVYERPATRWAATFLGDANLIEARVEGVMVEGKRRLIRLDVEGRTHLVDESRSEPAPEPGAQVAIAVRAERLRLAAAPPADGNWLPAVAEESVYKGGMTSVRLRRPDGATLRAERANGEADATSFLRGASVFASYAPEAARVLTR